MIIAVNTRLFIPGRLDGISRFAFESLSRITKGNPDVKFVFLFDRKISDEFIFSANITPMKLLPPARRPWLFNIWLDHSVYGALKKIQPQLFFSPDGFLPLRGTTPCLPVIHDLNFEHYQEDVPPNIAKWYRTKFPLFAKRAARIATVSEFSKNDIAEKYSIAKEKIDVVYNGAKKGFVPLSKETIGEVRKKYAAGAPYFLFIGALHPRKNLERLILAFAEFKKKNDADVKLLIAGEKYWSYDSLKAALEKVPSKDSVIFAGRLSDDELHRVTAAALALTYVPYFEGFGIPIVEAMACDVPVITSNVTSMPEVGGDAALYCDPFSVESITEALTKMSKDEALRNSLIIKAKVQREKFSWDKTADLVWKSMERTMGSKS
ncbi:MAG TPA: glycosyltransferase family 1 protein [Bacteroidia bacterium]|nr:glycosyltransferase family 1 protein [Bacteroidia bacterium]